MAQNSINVGLNVTLNPQSLSAATRDIKQSLGRITGSASEFQKSLDASTARVFAFGATTTVITGVSQAFQALVSTTINVEKRLIEINSIFGGTSSEFNKFREDIFKVAKDTGQSFDTVADAAAEFARQGLSAAETAKRLEAALILTRVSGLDSVKSVEALTAAINGFTSASLSAAQITNKLIAVDTAFAVSSKDLAEGFSRAGSTAEDAGVSFDELLGIITAVQQTTSRGGAVIGNALKSIFTRLSRTSTIEDLQALGVAIDSSQTGIQKLRALSQALEQISDPSQANAIKELAGGVYQINIVSAALKDLSKETSIFSQATAASVGATNEAFQKNAALNKSLAAQLNGLVVNVTNLGEKIGQLTFAPLLSTLLGAATKISDFFNEALDPEKGNKFIQGILKSIGSFLSGPGLVLITTAFFKIISLVAKFAKEGFSSVMALGSQSEKIKSVQAGIVNSLVTDKKFRDQILDTTLTQAQKQQAVADAIARENKLLREQQQILQALSQMAIKAGVSGFNPQKGFTSKNKAAGFVPNFAASAQETIMEKAAAKQHGYTAGRVYNTKLYDGQGGSFEATVNGAEKVKTVRGQNGKLGTYVIPPNGFAAKGFIPNFVKLPKAKTASNQQIQDAIRDGKLDPATKDKYIFPDGSVAYPSKIAIANNFGQSKGSAIDVSSFIKTPLPTILTPNSEGIFETRSQKLFGDRDGIFKFQAHKVQGDGIKSLLQEQVEKDFSKEAIETFAREKTLGLAQSISSALGGNPATPETLDKVDKVKGFVGAVRGAFGSLFDSAVTTALGLTAQQSDTQGDFDVRLDRKNGEQRKQLNALFGRGAIPRSRLADFKIGTSKDNIDNMKAKVIKEYNLDGLKKNKASGFIPNFAKYVYDSDILPAELRGSILKSIISSKKKKDLLLSPAGAGKSTKASGAGQFIKSMEDVNKATEFLILSASARAKDGISKPLQEILGSVNASGGVVEYLHKSNLDILNQRRGRVAGIGGDLRTDKQLKGTKYAPLNQYDFLQKVKASSARFKLTNAASGFAPNFAAVEDAIKREKKAGIPSSAIYIDQNSQLKSSKNPAGLMVANSIDEPKGGFQGINRAKKEGINPRKYGAAGGFVPNFAQRTAQAKIGNLGNTGLSSRADSYVTDGLLALAKAIKAKKITVEQATKSFELITKASGASVNQQKILNDKGKTLIETYGKEIAARQETAKSLNRQRTVSQVGGKIKGGVNKVSDKLGGIQTGLFALSVAANSLPKEFDELNGVIQQSVVAISTLSALSSIVPLLSNPLTLVGAAALAAGAALYKLEKRSQEIQEKSISASRDAQIKFQEKNQRDITNLEVSGASTEEVDKFKKARAELLLRQQSQSNVSQQLSKAQEGSAKFGAVNSLSFGLAEKTPSGKFLKSFVGADKEEGLKNNLKKQNEAVARAAAAAAAAGDAAKAAEEKNKKTLKSASSISTRNNATGEFASLAIKNLNETEGRGIDLSSKKSELRNKIDSSKTSPEERAKANEELKKVEEDIIKNQKDYKKALELINEVVTLGAGDLSDTFKTQGQILKNNLQTLSNFIAAGAKYFARQEKTLDVAKGITGFENEKFGQSTKNLLNTRSSTNTAQKDRFDFNKTLLDFAANTQTDASVLKVDDRSEKFKESEINRLKSESGGKEISQEQLNEINIKASKIKSEDENLAKSKAAAGFKDLEAGLKSGEISSKLREALIRDGEEGFKELFSKSFSNVNIEDGAGKEVYNQLLEGAKASAASLEKAGIDAGNALRNVQNEILKNNLELVKAQKDALSGLSDKLKTLSEGTKVDPLALFEKLKKAAELINSGKKGDVQRGNEILIGANEEIKSFKSSFGEEAFQNLQEKSGFKAGDVAKSTEAAALANVDFNSIIQKLADSGRFSAAEAARNVAANPTQAGIGELINIIKQGYANTTGKERQTGSNMVGALQFATKEGPNFKDITASLKKELDLSLVSDEDRKKVSDALNKFKGNMEDPKLLEDLKKEISAATGKNGGPDLGSKFADAYKKSAESKSAFSPEDDIVKGLTERQKQLQVEMNNAQIEVDKFKQAFAGSTMLSTIAALETSMQEASKGITSYATLTTQLGIISQALGKDIGEIKGKLASISPNP